MAQFIRFGSIGLINTLIDFGLLNVLAWFLGRPGGTGLLIINAVAFAGASLNSYLCNRRWTFSAAGEATAGEFGCFLLIAGAGLLINSLLLWLLTAGLPVSWLQLNLAKGVATAASMGWNFAGYRLLLTR